MNWSTQRASERGEGRVQERGYRSPVWLVSDASDDSIMKTAAGGQWKNVAEAWISLKRLDSFFLKPKLPPGTDASDLLEEDLELPSFDPLWKTEFEQTQVHALQIKLIAAFVGPPLAYATYIYLVAEKAHGFSHGSWKWTALQWGGYCMVVLLAFIVLAVYSIPWAPLRRFSVSNFSFLAGSALVCTLTGLFFTSAMTELRRSTFHERVNMYDTNSSSAFENITYSIDRSRFFPQAMCYDSSAPQTLLTWNSFDEPGCSSRLVYGTTITNLVACSMFSSVLNLSLKHSIQITVLVQILFAIIFLTVGKHAGAMWATLVLIGIAGLVDALQCHLRRENEAQEFIALKVQKFGSAQQRKLLHTLIPPNVLDNMRGPNQGRCAEIQHVTMMFCSFDFYVSSKADFDFLECVLEALDKSVKYSGMHKYQHVSCGDKHYYIVGCPRIACPYDLAEQLLEYPANYSVNMIQLGRQLTRTTSKFAAPNRPLQMKVGINCGPVASVVLGKCRRFYCVYGNTGI